MASAPPVTATTEPAQEKQAPHTVRRDRGIVKSALSGDTLVVWDDKPGPQGPTDKIITLSSLLAPKMARGDAKEEQWAFESREFLRKKAVGKKIQYAIDHSTGTREYVTAYLAPVGGNDPECINHSVVAEGWARVHNKDAKRAETLVQLEDAAMQAGKGIHKERPKADKSEQPEDADSLEKNLKGKQINAVVEQVRTGSSIRVTALLPTSHPQIQILLTGVQAPGWKKIPSEAEPKADDFAREAKSFVETHILQRDVVLTIDGGANPGPGVFQNL